MKRNLRFVMFSVIALAGLVLAACGPIPPGTVIHIAPNGQSAQVEFTGQVNSISAGQWVVSGHTILISQNTAIGNSIAAGNTVRVDATVDINGSVTADSIQPASADLQTSFAYPSGLEQTVTNTPNSSGTPDMTGTPEATGTPAASDTPGDTATPKPTRTDEPESTQEGHEPPGVPPMKGFIGQLDLVGAVGSMSSTQWVVSGLTFGISSFTKIDGTFSAGDLVHVHAWVMSGGTFNAIAIWPGRSEFASPWQPGIHGHRRHDERFAVDDQRLCD